MGGFIMNLSEINPYIRLTMYSTLFVPSQIKRRIILDYELIYIESGRFRLNYNNYDYICEKGDFLFLCPSVPHSFHIFDTDVIQPHIHFDMQYTHDSKDVFVSFQDYQELSKSERALIRENVFPSLKNKPPFIKIKDQERFLKIFYEIVLAKHPSLLNTLEYKAKMLTLLSEVISENAPDDFLPATNNFKIAPLVKTYLDANYDQNIQLANLEQHFNYSKFYIEKAFTQKYGISPIKYRNKKRLAKAASLLGNQSVTTIAHQVGFTSVYAFSRAFHSVYGVSPTQYIYLRQKGHVQANDVRADAAQTDTAQTNAGQTNDIQADTPQTDAIQTDTTQTDAAQADAGQANDIHADTPQTDDGQTDAAQTDTTQADATQTDITQAGAAWTDASYPKSS